MDTLSPEQRSEVMSRIRSKDTKLEMVVHHHLHALEVRYSLHSPKLPGHPDIVLPKWHTVTEVNGCFWHRHKECKTATSPSPTWSSGRPSSTGTLPVTERNTQPWKLQAGM